MFALSNVISYVRFLLLPLIAITILNKNMNVALILILVSYLTDITDGIVARRLHQESEFGKIIDPFADKLTFITVLICLAIIKKFPMWAMFILAGREILFLVGGLYLIIRKLKVIPASIVGKITGSIFGIMIITYLLDFKPLLNITLVAALVIMVISFVYYSRRFILMLQQTNET